MNAGVKRSIVCLSAVALLAASHRAEAQFWAPCGVALSTAAGDQWDPAIVSDGAGGAIVAWADYRGTVTPVIYVQRVDSTGISQWAQDGVPLCTVPSSGNDITMIPDGAGGAIVTWDDARNGVFNIYAQRVNAGGTPEWTSNGVPVCVDPSGQRDPQIVSDGENGAIIAWSDYRGSLQVFAQRLDPMGAPQWISNGVSVFPTSNQLGSPRITSDGAGGAIVICSSFINDDVFAQRVDSAAVLRWFPHVWGSNLLDPVVTSDGSGGAIVAWESNDDIYASRVDSAGSGLWSYKPVCKATGVQLNPAIVSDGAGGAIIAWDDKRNGRDDYYAQRLDPAGSPQWTPDGQAVCALAGVRAYLDMTSDGAGGALFTWEDERFGSNDIFAQRLDHTGFPRWNNSGLLMCSDASGHRAPRIVSDGADGAVVAYEDGVGTSDVHAQRLKAFDIPGSMALCTATGQQTQPLMATDGANGAIVVWRDFRNGPNPSIYAQRVNGANVPQWTVDGVALCTAAVSKTSLKVISDGAGGAIVAWTDGRNGPADIFAQRVSAAGVAQWAPDGVAVCTATNSQNTPALVSDGAGGAIITWTDRRSGADDIYAQRVNAAGVPQWTPDGVALCTATNSQNSPAIVSDGAGGAIVTWTDARHSENTDIYARRVDASGVPQWTSNGVGVCTDPSPQLAPVCTSDGAGGAILAWRDSRNTYVPGEGGLLDVYAQRVNAAGARLWASDVAVCTAGDEGPPAILSDPAGGAIVTWGNRHFTGGLSTFLFFAQRLSSAGTSQWPANGVQLGSYPVTSSTPIVATDGAGGEFLTWHADQTGFSLDIYGQHVDAAGTPQWGGSGTGLCLVFSDQSQPAIVSDNAGGAVLAWVDQRNGDQDIYASRVSGGGQVAAVDPASDSGSAPALAWPNPFRNEVSIAFSLPSRASVRMEVFDVAGRRVWASPATAFDAGRHALEWDGRTETGVAAGDGIYFLDVRGHRFEVRRTVVLER